MRRAFLYMTMTLDGYLAGPNNELDWFTPSEDPQLVGDIVAIIGSADTGVMGYPTGPGMIAYWAGIEKDPNASLADHAIAGVISHLHTVVLSNAQVELSTKNAELLVVKDDSELIHAVTQLKQRPGKDIGIPGGVRTAQKFARLGLLDEYILMVHPVAIGAGKPLFTSRLNLELSFAKTYQSGVVQLRYHSRQAE